MGKGHKYGLIVPARGLRDATSSHLPVGKATLQFLANYVDPREVYFTNLIKEPHSMKRRIYAATLKKHLPYLIDELTYVFGGSETPSRIIVQGSLVAKHLCPGFQDLNQDHGSFFFNPSLNAYVIPTYQFSNVARSPRMREWVEKDMERAFNLPDPVSPTYHLINLVKGDWKPEPNSTLFLDIETQAATENDSALNVETAKIISIGMKTKNAEVHIIEDPNRKQLAKLHNHIREQEITVVGHNLAFDLAMLSWREGVLWDDVKTADTMLMAYVLGHTSKSLKHLTSLLTNRPGSRSFGGVTDLPYLAEDVLSTEELYGILEPQVAPRYATGLLNDLVPKFIGMRQSGVAIDNEAFKTIVPQLEAEASQAEQELNRKYNGGVAINWNSNETVAERLVHHKIPLRKRTPGGKLSVAAPILEKLRSNHAIIDDLLSWRSQTKTLAFLHSYKDFLHYDGRLHPSLMLDGTETGRLSCKDPNLQQVPAKGIIKTMFVSQFEGGKLGLVDLAQAELRVAAHLSGDQEFIKALNQQDVHRYIASLVYAIPLDQVTKEQRTNSKQIVFGLMYGGQPRGLAARLGVDVREVEYVVNSFFGKFPVLLRWLEEQKYRGVADKQITTLFGRVRDFRDALVYEDAMAVERKAVNSPVQGTASDVMLIIMDKIYTECLRLGLKSRPIFGVHDSTIIDIHPDEVDQIAGVVDSGFKAIALSPLGELDAWGGLAITGELILGKTWASVENTSEYYKPERLFAVSSHDPVEEIAASHYEAELELEDED